MQEEGQGAVEDCKKKVRTRRQRKQVDDSIKQIGEVSLTTQFTEKTFCFFPKCVFEAWQTFDAVAIILRYPGGKEATFLFFLRAAWADVGGSRLERCVFLEKRMR